MNKAKNGQEMEEPIYSTFKPNQLSAASSKQSINFEEEEQLQEKEDLVFNGKGGSKLL